MRSIYFFAALFVKPILGITAEDIVQLKDKFPDLLVQMLGEEANAWRDVYCDAPGLDDKYNDPTQQWDSAQATNAFLVAYKQWKDEGQTRGFTNYIFNFFNGNPTVVCTNPGDVGCSAGTVCGQKDIAGSVNSPAGYVILK